MKVLINLPGTTGKEPELRAAAPQAEFVVVTSRDDLLAAGGEAEVVWGTRWLAELLAVQNRLRWVASASAGIERLLPLLTDHPEVILTTGAGAYNVPIAEHLLALLLALRRELGWAARSQAEHRWQRRNGARELRGSTLGIVGLGNIGRELAQMASAGLGLRVLGQKLRPSGPVPGVETLYYGREGLLAMLPQCDQVAVTAALSPAAHGLLDAAALDLLPPHAVILNIGRGRIIDEEALLERLRDGRLAGAGLDVFATEPLPPESGLWDLPQVIVTAHYAGTSHRIAERRLALFAEQLRRYVAGEPLANQVDRAAGY